MYVRHHPRASGYGCRRGHKFLGYARVRIRSAFRNGLRECFHSPPRRDRPRQLDQECGPARAGALDADPPAVRGQELAGDREPDAAAASTAGPRVDGARWVGAVEALEDVRDVGRRDPRSLVGDPDRDERAPAGASPDRTATRPAVGAVGHRVADDVAQDPREVARVDRRRSSRPGTFDSRRSATFAAEAVELALDLVDRGWPRSTAVGCAWSGAASALARSLSSATMLPSAVAAERAASRFSRSAGTTPSTIAWICETSTVAGVARSWAMSLARAGAGASPTVRGGRPSR